LWLLSVA